MDGMDDMTQQVFDHQEGSMNLHLVQLKAHEVDGQTYYVTTFERAPPSRSAG